MPFANLRVLHQHPFYRVEASRNRKTGGTGLGRTIACGIARGHGGDVVLRNHPGHAHAAALNRGQAPRSKIEPATLATTHHATTISGDARHATSSMKPTSAMATSIGPRTALVQTGS